MARLSDSITYGNHAITGDVNVGGTLTVDGDVYLGGTVDGRNVSSDGSKLDNIESNATADQTNSEIKIAYEANADTNEFSDSEQTKLSNVEANATADQTKIDIDALNIDADTLDGINSTQFVRSDTGKIPEDRLPATITNQTRFSNSTTYFGGTDGNTAEIWMQTGGAGSPQIGLTDNNGDMAWAIGGDDTGNSFKIHGNASGSIPTIDNVSNPFFEISTSGVISGNGSGLTGTASLRATGTTKADVGLSKLSNMNVDVQATGNTIMARDSSGDTYARLYTSTYNNTNSDIDGIYTTKTIGGDYMRPSTPAQLKASLNLGVGDVSGLQNALDDKTPVGHGHAISDITNLQLTLYGKLGTNAKAADSDKLNGLVAGNFIRSAGNDRVFGNTEWQDNSAVRFGDSADMRIYHDGSDNRIDLHKGDLTIRSVTGIGTNTQFIFDRDVGDFTASGSITEYSDERVKDDFKVIDGALDRVDQLTGYTYERTDVETDRETGLIAQEVLKVLPEAVKYNAETDRYSLAYGNMMGLMVEAIKELKQEVEALKQKQGA